MARGAREELSAGGVVFRVRNGVPHFLLIRDSYRNWGFPKGHVEAGEALDAAAIREVREETGLDELVVCGATDPIAWYFRFRGRLIHKTCHFYVMESASGATHPQREEGITGCRWLSLERARELLAYENARQVLEQGAAVAAAVAAGGGCCGG